MSARELFEKLGYYFDTNKFDKDNSILTYRANYDMVSTINFYKRGLYSITIYDTKKRISNELLEAINKQIEELWGEEVLKNDGNK
jgi:hypothetical protein